MRVVKLTTDVDVEIINGLKLPSRILAHKQDTAIFLADSHNRLYGTPDAFICKITGGYQRILSAQVTRIIFPLCPNINALNNTITIRSEASEFNHTFNLSIGFYNQNSLLTELKNKLDTAFHTMDSFSVDYEPGNRTISITSNSGYKWFFSSECSFIKRGVHMCGFTGNSLLLNPGDVGAITQNSAQVGLIYTRYLSVFSNTLTRYSRSGSVSPLGVGGLIALPALPELTNKDFDLNGLYTGIFKIDASTNSSIKTAIALNDSLLNEIDISVFDEFGFPYSQCSVLGSGISNMNILVWLKFTL